jgi:hypothetical protein
MTICDRCWQMRKEVVEAGSSIRISFEVYPMQGEPHKIDKPEWFGVCEPCENHLKFTAKKFLLGEIEVPVSKGE